MAGVDRYAVILAFDVKVERESQEMADSLGVRIFSAEIIYHLFDAFTKYREDYKKAKQDEFRWEKLALFLVFTFIRFITFYWEQSWIFQPSHIRLLA